MIHVDEDPFSFETPYEFEDTRYVDRHQRLRMSLFEEQTTLSDSESSCPCSGHVDKLLCLMDHIVTSNPDFFPRSILHEIPTLNGIPRGSDHLTVISMYLSPSDGGFEFAQPERFAHFVELGEEDAFERGVKLPSREPLASRP